MAVYHQNVQYKARQKMRQRIRDAIYGIDVIRSRTIQYIPLPDSQCAQNSQRYKDYLARTYYVNTPLRTITTLAGLLSNKEPDIQLDSQMEYLRENIDGSNTQFNQQIKDQSNEVLSLGRAGVAAIFKDRPETGVNGANADMFLPIIRAYKEEQIINWRTKDGKLTLIVLREHETVPSADDEFEEAVRVSFRVFDIKDGQVRQRLYTSDAKNALIEVTSVEFDEYSNVINLPGNWDINESMLFEAGNKPMTGIPFSFIGSINNDSECDPSPILNIVDLALTYYRLSADEQLNVHLTACGFVTIKTELEPDQWQKFNGSLTIDASFGTYFVGENGEMNYVQAMESASVNKSMDRVLKDSVSMGAQIITDAVTDKTATEARINNASNTSQLVQIAQNISDAYTRILKVIARVLGVSDDVWLSIPTEFFDNEASPDMIRAMAEAVIKGEMSRTDFLNWQKRVGIIDEDRTVDDVMTELQDKEDENALSGGVVVPQM